MTLDELEKLARDAPRYVCIRDVGTDSPDTSNAIRCPIREFGSAANPQVVLALIEVARAVDDEMRSPGGDLSEVVKASDRLYEVMK